MNVDRMTRVNALLKREIGEALFRIPALARLDLSAVTVTHVNTGRSLRSATVFVSVRDHESERPRIIGALMRHRGQIQEIVGKNCVLKYTPCLTFLLDESIEKGDHVLGLLDAMESEEQEQPDQDGNGDGAAEVVVAEAEPQERQAFIPVPDGVLLVDKLTGLTSHDVVDVVRRKLGIDRVGHGGTLDPLATGLLVILIGRGTKLSDVFMGSDKIYSGTMRLGMKTDTEDAFGTKVGEADFSHVTKEALEGEMASRTGDMWQRPPMVSAVKIDGVPLYKRARKGQTVDREPRLIHVYEFRMTSFALPRAGFVLRCGKGTYVRTLCSEVGEALGCGAYLEELRRLASGSLKVENAIPVSDLVILPREEVIRRILPVGQFAAARGAGRTQ